MVWLEGHEDVWVVAADGVEVKPRKLDALILFPGERYDLLIKLGGEGRKRWMGGWMEWRNGLQGIGQAGEEGILADSGDHGGDQLGLDAGQATAGLGQIEL